ncbi:MAG: hypothetical protein KME17_23705 [Cyanosarcina radialis HA8281-LM2]|nr:hypothetical protein [Cyanosarcina radialis HA8281-LM2]
MVKIELFNVDRGFCAAIEADNRHTILFDCGYSFRNGFRPARYLLSKPSLHLDYLIVPAYTTGHLVGFSDLIGHFLERRFSIDYLIANPSLDPDSLPELAVRNSGASEFLKSLNRVFEGCGDVEQKMHLGNVKVAFFWNNYPNFLDLRNLGLVMFLSYRDINIVFPSDLKIPGWRSLLKNPEFRDCLRQVNIFVASNHGQEDGYCPEVFNYCHPDLVIISNQVHQELPSVMLREYEGYAGGLRTNIGKQKVLTTRDAGTIAIHQSRDARLEVIAGQHESYRY